MSTRGIPYPPDFQIDYDADRHEARRRWALKTLAIGDVLAQVDDLIAQEADPTQHPCHDLVAFVLGRKLAVDGGELYDRWKRLWSAKTLCASHAPRRRRFGLPPLHLELDAK